MFVVIMQSIDYNLLKTNIASYWIHNYSVYLFQFTTEFSNLYNYEILQPPQFSIVYNCFGFFATLSSLAVGFSSYKAVIWLLSKVRSLWICCLV